MIQSEGQCQCGSSDGLALDAGLRRPPYRKSQAFLLTNVGRVESVLRSPSPPFPPFTLMVFQPAPKLRFTIDGSDALTNLSTAAARWSMTVNAHFPGCLFLPWSVSAQRSASLSMEVDAEDAAGHTLATATTIEKFPPPATGVKKNGEELDGTLQQDRVNHALQGIGAAIAVARRRKVRVATTLLDDEPAAESVVGRIPRRRSPSILYAWIRRGSPTSNPWLRIPSECLARPTS